MHLIKATITFEAPFWVGIFECQEGDEYTTAKHIFGPEPTDPEVYDFVLHHYDQLRFTRPITLDDVQIKIKRINPKRLKRQVRKEMEKAASYNSLAQEVQRLEIEQNKKTRKTISAAEKSAKKKALFDRKQAEKKQKKRGK